MKNNTFFLQVNKMNLETVEDGFVLESTDPKTSNVAFLCQASTPELQEQWLMTVRNILQRQRDFIMALQSPIDFIKYQEVKKDKTKT